MTTILVWGWRSHGWRSDGGCLTPRATGQPQAHHLPDDAAGLFRLVELVQADLVPFGAAALILVISDGPLLGGGRVRLQWSHDGHRRLVTIHDGVCSRLDDLLAELLDGFELLPGLEVPDVELVLHVREGFG